MDSEQKKAYKEFAHYAGLGDKPKRHIYRGIVFEVYSLSDDYDQKVYQAWALGLGLIGESIGRQIGRYGHYRYVEASRTEAVEDTQKRIDIHHPYFLRRQFGYLAKSLNDIKPGSYWNDSYLAFVKTLDERELVRLEQAFEEGWWLD